MSGEIEKEIKCCREKYWSEKSDKECIEKLKDELRRTQQQVKILCDYVTKLMEHEHHHLNGQMIAKIPHPNQESCGGIYFRVENFKDGNQ